MGGVNTVFQVVHDVGNRVIIVSVVVDPTGGPSEEDQYHAVLFSTINSDQVYDWEHFQLMNENSRPWLIKKVREVIVKELVREQVGLSATLKKISKGVPKQRESASKCTLTKALPICMIITGKKR